jgi:hypothetical protein
VHREKHHKVRTLPVAVNCMRSEKLPEIFSLASGCSDTTCMYGGSSLVHVD